MKRTPLKDRSLPSYTRGEEMFNMVSHIVGAGFGFVYLILCVVAAALEHSIIGVISAVIYGVSVVTLFTMSSVYHGLKHSTAKKVMQILDHCTIYFMIAGTYTPLALCAVKGQNEVAGWTLFILIWSITMIAMTFTAIDHHKFKVFSMICYLGMGWCVVAFWKYTYAAVGQMGALYMILGGVLYTIGAILYMFGSKVRYIHSLFHLFVDAASLMHFFCIVFYVL